MESHSKVILVTGASEGIGLATVQFLAAEGFQVYGTSRRPEKAGAIDGAKFLSMDVREDESVRLAVSRISEEAGGIDVLVNNAGVTCFGAVEEFSMTEAKDLFETNFFGVMRTTLAVLPQMRERGSGRIINVGSIAGFLPTPFETLYGASKHALEGFSESLRYEVGQFGIRVSLIEPGFIRTSMDRNCGEAARRIESYAKHRKAVMEDGNRSIQKGAPPELVARIVLQSIRSRNPKLRYLAGWDAIGLRLARSLVPPPIFSMGVQAEFGLK